MLCVKSPTLVTEHGWLMKDNYQCGSEALTLRFVAFIRELPPNPFPKSSFRMGRTSFPRECSQVKQRQQAL